MHRKKHCKKYPGLLGLGRKERKQPIFSARYYSKHLICIVSFEVPHDVLWQTVLQSPL